MFFVFINWVISIVIWLVVAYLFHFSISGMLIGFVVSYLYKEFIGPVFTVASGEKLLNKTTIPQETVLNQQKIEEWIYKTKNLNVETFRNGDRIPMARNIQEWNRAYLNSSPLWCYYNDDQTNGGKSGKLYNWYAVNDLRGLAPEGWHVPTKEEFEILSKTLVVQDNLIDALNKRDETDLRIFPALSDGGERKSDGSFEDLGERSNFWSSSEFASDSAYFMFTNYYGGYGGFTCGNKRYGFSVRCLKDNL